MRYRLLALDIDGTLLDPYGELPDAAREAVARARRGGLAVVVCTGRRFRTALPILERLGLEGPAVVNNGALVKEAGSGRTLHQHYLPAGLYPELLALMREVAPPLVYVDGYSEGVDILTDRAGQAHPFQVDYLMDNPDHCRVVEDLARERRDDLIMLSLMADEERLRPLRERADRSQDGRIHTQIIRNQGYQGHILEFFSPASGKWAGLLRVATDLGIQPDQIAAVGDDLNDVELLMRAGLGIAMANGAPEARAAADQVVRSNAEGGVVEAIERVLLAP